jgi:hypothetical protein
LQLHLAGQSEKPTVHIQSVNISVPPGTSQQQADSLFRQFVEKLTQYYQSQSRTQGDIATLPLMPPIAGQANYTPGGGAHP